MHLHLQAYFNLAMALGLGIPNINDIYLREDAKKIMSMTNAFEIDPAGIRVSLSCRPLSIPSAAMAS